MDTIIINGVDLCRITDAEDLEAFLNGIKAKIIDKNHEVVPIQNLVDTFITEESFLREIIKITGVDPVVLKNMPEYRKRAYVLTRQLHCMVRAQVFNMILAEAGEVYGKDHATVLHGIKVVNNLRETNAEFRGKTERLMFMVKFYQGRKINNGN
jgi:chromosomal replication initiation ATPase DnaA